MSIIKNLTPHVVNICDENCKVIRVIESEGIARCQATITTTGAIDGIPLSSTIFGAVCDLPKEEDGVFFIVSRLVMSASPNRKDLLVPNELVRDESNNIIGCKSLSNN